MEYILITATILILAVNAVFKVSLNYLFYSLLTVHTDQLNEWGNLIRVRIIIEVLVIALTVALTVAERSAKYGP